MLNRKDVRRKWLFERCREVQENPDNFLDLWSREHYKSTIITFAKTIQDILIDPNKTIGIFSHTRPIAKSFLRQIKREFEDNKVLQEVFDDILWSNTKDAPKWSEDDGLIVKRSNNPKEATVEAWGLVDGQPIGKHFDKLVYDDVVTQASVTTPDMMEKTMQALELSYNLGAAGGCRRFIGTRYHFNDAYKTIMERGTAKARIYTATIDGTVTGEPVLLTSEELANKRRDMGSYTFSCQMLQNPVADDLQGFKRSDIQYYDKINEDLLNKYIIVDPANAKKKTNDYSVFWVIGVGEDKNLYVLNMIRDRLNLSERTKLLFELHRKYKPIQVRYERYGMQADIEHIQEKQSDEAYRFEIVEVGGQTPKNDRILRLLPYFEQHKIIFPRTLYYTDYQKVTGDLVAIFIEQEYMAFPVPHHDDMLDSLARMVDPDFKIIYPSTKTPVQFNSGKKKSSWMC